MLTNQNSNNSITIYLIRHGESLMNRDNKDLIGGRSPETQLSKNGESQSKKLGKYFKKQSIKIDKVYSSPLIRAWKTAEIFTLASDFDKNIIKVSELTELSQGDWEGEPRKKIYSEKNLKKINTQGNFFTPPNGESKAMVIQRSSKWLLEEIIDLENPSSSVVICHGILIKCLLQYIMNFNDSMVHKIDIDNTSITKLTFDSAGWHVNYINSTIHLI